jgi:hypothetical protein
MASRNPFYERAADAEIDTSGLDVEGVIEAVLSIMEKMGGLHWAGIRSEGISG